MINEDILPIFAHYQHNGKNNKIPRIFEHQFLKNRMSDLVQILVAFLSAVGLDFNLKKRSLILSIIPHFMKNQLCKEDKKTQECILHYNWLLTLIMTIYGIFKMKTMKISFASTMVL